MRKRMLLLMLVAVVLVGLVGCGSEPTATVVPPTEAPPTEAPAEEVVAEEPEEAAETLKIGTLVSLEFPLGVDMQKELDALVPVINEQGGIKVGDKQVPIEIILYDTKLNPETGRAGAERLVFEDEVDFILGDETTDAWLSVTEGEDVLVVAMSPSPGVFDPQYNRVFQAGKINSDAGAMWGWLADNHPEFKTVVAMFPDDGKGQAEAGMLQQIADAYGFELLDVIFYEPGTSDFSTYATRLATLNPDLYTTAAGGPVQDAMSMRAMREAGWDGQIFLKTTLSPQKMSEIIDLSLVEGTIAGMAGTTVPEPPPIAQELIDAYTEAYGAWDAPEVLHVLTFYVLKAAIEAAGSLDVDDVSAALLDGLAFDSPAGAGIMAARPDLGNERAIDTIYESTIGQIVNGEAVVIGTVPIEKVIDYNNVLRGLEEDVAEAPAEVGETLKIGTLVSLEFPLGVDMQKELDALVPVINEQGGIKVGDKQHPIEIILYDTKLNPETGRAGAERLVFEDEVDFILGDETTDAWLSVTEAEDVLVVAMSPSPGVFDPQYNRVFQAGKINSDAGAMWGWLADNHPEFKTVVAMFPDDGKGQAEAGMLQQIADAYGYDLLDVIFYEPGTSDFSTYATRLATLDPDLYTTAAGGPVQDAMSMRAMREAGWDGQIFLKTTLSPQKMSEIIDLSLVEGTIAGMAGTTVPEPPPIAQELIDAYTEAYGAWDAPEVLHVLTFYVLKAAIEAAGSLDVDDVSAALLGGLAFDSPAGAGIMAARPDLGNERAIDTIYETTIGQIVNGEAVVIGTVPIEKVIEYNNVLRGLE